MRLDYCKVSTIYIDLIADVRLQRNIHSSCVQSSPHRDTTGVFTTKALYRSTSTLPYLTLPQVYGRPTV